MRFRIGNVWDQHPSTFVVVPCNIGWKSSGGSVMGRGVAKEAADRFPDIVDWWGFQCRRYREDTPVMMHQRNRLIMFPTKPMNEDQPWMSWRGDADSKLVWRSAAQLAAFTLDGESIDIPLVGCGNGRLTPELVLPILHSFLGHDRYRLVLQSEAQMPLVEGIIKGKWSNWLLMEDPRPGDGGKPAGTHFLREPESWQS